jgi:hypothetical protein
MRKLGVFAVIGTSVILALSGCATQTSSGHQNVSGGASANKTPTPSPSHTEAAMSATNIEQLIAANEINANQDPTALSSDILAKFTAWDMYGSDTVGEKYLAIVRKTGDASAETEAKFLESYVTEGESIFAPAMFGADYKSNPAIQETITKQREINQVALQDVIITQKDKNPYTRGQKLLALVDSTPTSLAINYTQIDNAGTDENKIPAANSINGINGRLTVVYKVQAGKLVLTTAQF